MAKKQETTIKAKKSAWSSFSIWWGVLVFCLLIPVLLIVYYTQDYTVYMQGLREHIETLGKAEIQTFGDYKKALANNALIGAEIYNGKGSIFGMIKLTKKFFIDMDMSAEEVETLAEIILAVGIVCIILAVCSLVKRIASAKRTSYEFSHNCVIIREGRLFKNKEEIRRLVFLPGMSVSVRQNFKGKIFSYGDVVLSMGHGEAGEVVMQGVKRPRKLKKKLARAIRENCVIMPYMNPTYAMPPQMVTYGMNTYPVISK